ncbi:HmuY family protein [Sphingobacterium corticis]|uniref:HmuY family protein n=1 Tax=Sphingobacterium corticis TaxID=1812823 RepID=A0ABW5NN63_9SPHI
MKYYQTNQKTRHRASWMLGLLGIAGMLNSCGEIYDLNAFVWEPEIPLNDSVFNREIYVHNLALDGVEGLTGQPPDYLDPILFSLERFSVVHPGYKISDRWDLGMGGSFGVSISGNNGSRRGLGYGSSSVGGYALMDTAYSQVQDLPTSMTIMEPGLTSLDAQGAAGSGMGPFAYTFGGNFIRPDKVVNLGSQDPVLAHEAFMYSHLIYALSEDLIKSFPTAQNAQRAGLLRPRTLIVRTARGNFAKLEFLSYYKDTIDPKNMKRDQRNTPFGYFSFRYILIKADEVRFGFVKRRPSMTVDVSRKKTTVHYDEQI